MHLTAGKDGKEGAELGTGALTPGAALRGSRARAYWGRCWVLRVERRSPTVPPSALRPHFRYGCG